LLLCTTSAQEYYGQFLTPDPAVLGQPSQIHLQLGGGSSYVVNWHSVINQLGGFDYKSTPAWDSHPPPQLKQMDDLKQLGPFLSLVRYGPAPDRLDLNASSVPVLWTEQRCGTNRVRHSVLLPQLTPGVAVYYQVSAISGLVPGKEGLKSQTHRFMTLPELRSVPLRVSVAIDMGSGSPLVRNTERGDNRTYPDAIGQLNKDTSAEAHDLVLHPGDIAYSLDDDCGRVGDLFFEITQPTASVVPYMTSPGNHEWGRGQTWSVFDDRYAGQRHIAAASGSITARYYSFNAGRTHWVMLDTNPWIYAHSESPAGYFAAAQVEMQWYWLQRDLQRVNRTETPWTVVLGHHGLYDATGSGDLIGPTQCVSRGIAQFSIEPLLNKHGVNMYLAGHVHHYLRTWPLKNGTVTGHSYHNASGTVHIITGVGGAVDTDSFDKYPVAAYEAFRDDHGDCKPHCRRGFGRITVHNDTHLEYQQLSVDGEAIDGFTIFRDV